MEFCVTTPKDNSWLIGTDSYDPKMINKLETIMFQGNGYFGMRATSEEEQLNEKRDMFVSGTFDAFPSEVPELPNLPDIINMEIKIDGLPFCLKDGRIRNYHKYLNMKNGELIRELSWFINNKRIDFKFSRFVSMDDKHLFVSKVEINASDMINIQIRSGIDGQKSNSGTQHLTEGDKRLFDNRFIQLKGQAQQAKTNFVFNVRHRIYIDEVLLNIKPYIKMNRRQIFGNYDISLNPNQKFTLVKYANIFTDLDEGIDENNISDNSINALRKNCLFNYDELLSKSAKSWKNNVWNKSYVNIDAEDVDPQVAINFARYQLAANTPLDSRMNIGAKGITGEGYKGHTFWDTEIFMLPYYIFTMPDVAKSLLTYRYLGLAGAHKKAKANGYEGAQFPWEAAWPSDGETAPLWGSADIVTGKAMKIWSGFIEQHVTGDIVFAVMEYLNATDDKEFAEKMGYEIILDAAKFWVSRLEFDQDRDRYEITDVIGPDEYKEHADNNAFTNYIAHWCIQRAIDVTKMLKNSRPEIYEILNDKLDLERTYDEWTSKVDHIYLPQPNVDGVVPEDDTYLLKKKIDISRYQTDDNITEIFKDYNLDQVNNMQVTKQADVLLLMFLFSDLFDDDIKLTNWNYYEPKTTHDSSLSLSTHAILANDFKLDNTAYDFFEKACQIDLGNSLGKTEKGLHLASLGGIWNMIVEGFGGVRIIDGQLQINPHLPIAWNSLQYQINWHNSLLKVVVNDEKLGIEVVGDAVEIINNGRKYQVPANSKLELVMPEVEVEI